MADALASGASVLRDVGVQVPLRPQRAVPRTAAYEVTNQKWFVTFVFCGVVLPGCDFHGIGGLVAQIPIIVEAHPIRRGRARFAKEL